MANAQRDIRIRTENEIGGDFIRKWRIPVKHHHCPKEKIRMEIQIAEQNLISNNIVKLMAKNDRGLCF